MRKVSKTVLAIISAAVITMVSCNASSDQLLIVCPGRMIKQGTVADLTGTVIQFDDPNGSDEYILIRAEQCLGIGRKRTK